MTSAYMGVGLMPPSGGVYYKCKKLSFEGQAEAYSCKQVKSPLDATMELHFFAKLLPPFLHRKSLEHRLQAQVIIEYPDFPASGH